MRLAGGAARIPGDVNLVLQIGSVNHYPHITRLDCTNRWQRAGDLQPMSVGSSARSFERAHIGPRLAARASAWAARSV